MAEVLTDWPDGDVTPWWVDATAVRHAEIDRMARAAKRHIRYEREKACKAIARFRFEPLARSYTQKMVDVFWRNAAGSFAMSREYDAPFADARQTVAVRLPGSR